MFKHLSFIKLKVYYNKTLLITKSEYLGRPQIINKASSYTSTTLN